jgi:hypothetical protein
MKLVLLGAAVIAVALSVAGPPGAAGAFSCKVTRFKVDGHPAVTGCGPATATLTVAGRTYSFKNGECSISRGTGTNRVLHLDLGTGFEEDASDQSKVVNHGYPYFTITTMGTIATIVAASHGKLLTGTPGPSVYRFVGTYAGTFTSHAEVKFSGTWNCHGVAMKP